jgi:hypothetical protein
MDTSLSEPLWVEFSYEIPLNYTRLLVTRSHEVIRKWADQRCAEPAIGKGVSRDEDSQVLRFRFESGGSRVLKEVPWEEWFEIFDLRRLVFIFREDHQVGASNRFFRLSRIR